jgi:tRNA A37 methylthiotransferase MiaB
MAGDIYIFPMCAVEDSAREKSAGQAGNLIEAKQRARTFAVVGTRVLTQKKKTTPKRSRRKSSVAADVIR